MSKIWGIERGQFRPRSTKNMGRKTRDQKNTLDLRPVGSDKAFLSGYINGRQVRKTGSIAEMEALKAKLEIEALEHEAALNARHPLPDSWISIAQLRHAENAFLELEGSRHSLIDCVRAGLAHLGDGQPVLLADAVMAYHENLLERQLCERHRDNVKSRLGHFMQATKAKTLAEIAPEEIARFCLRAGLANYSKLTEGMLIQAFFNFCVGRKWLKVSPFTVDMEGLRKNAERGKARPRILSVDQAQALLTATCQTAGGNHVPYVILSLWGGIRRAEIARLTSKDIRFEGRGATIIIHPDVSKTASYREVNIPENVVPLLKECVDRGIIDETPQGDLLAHTWRIIRKNAGLLQVEYKKRPDGAGTTPALSATDWQGNILRHTGLSYYFRKTGNIQEVARQAGHSTAISFKHYISLARAEDCARFYAITGHLTPAGAIPKVA